MSHTLNHPPNHRSPMASPWVINILKIEVHMLYCYLYGNLKLLHALQPSIRDINCFFLSKEESYYSFFIDNDYLFANKEQKFSNIIWSVTDSPLSATHLGFWSWYSCPVRDKIQFSIQITTFHSGPGRITFTLLTKELTNSF